MELYTDKQKVDMELYTDEALAKPPVHAVGTEPDPPKSTEYGCFPLGGTTSVSSAGGFARASDKFKALTGVTPGRIPHWESWSCPDAESYITGIDYYAHPRLCRLEMNRRHPHIGLLYPDTGLPVPATDAPIPRPDTDDAGDSPSTDGQERHTVRWGDGQTKRWDWGRGFASAGEVLAFSPLADPDYTGRAFACAYDYSDENTLYANFRSRFPEEWGDRAPAGSTAAFGFYNTLFMWPLLTFGWQLFMETCLDGAFERVLDEFAEISRRAFRAIARLPVNFVVCHDDIVTTNGPVCSPAWMRRHIFPRYEEYWSLLRAAGKRVIFLCDGCVDAYADDVFACGADGIRTEPYTDFKAIARRHPDRVLAGEGDNRILMRDNPAEIRDMVVRMTETARMSGGYLMNIGNHITWNLPPRAVKLYLDLSEELARY